MLFRKKIEISGHAGSVYTCVYKDGFIYSGSGDNYVTRWIPTTGEQDKFAIKLDKSVYSLVFIDKNRLVVGLANGHVHVFDLNTNKEVKFLTQHEKGIFALAFNKEKTHLYIADAEGNLSIWDSNTLELHIYFPLNCGKVRDIAINENGEQFALACQDGKIRIFESDFFNEILTYDAHQNGATAVLYHPNDSLKLISGGKDALLKLWDLNTSTCLEEIPAHKFVIYSILSIDNGRTILSASRDKTIKVWSSDLEFQERLDVRTGGHRHSVNKIHSIDENHFVSVSDDRKIIVWERFSD